METKYIFNPNISTMAYPVGTHISKCVPVVLEMIKSFLTIEEFKDKGVNIICQGSSGAIIATIFSLNIPNPNKIIHIKKTGEDSHSSSINQQPDYVNVIVDDLISTGTTMNRIYENFSKVPNGSNIDCVCISGMLIWIC